MSVTRKITPNHETTQLKIEPDLQLKVNKQAVLVDYKNFSALVLYEPLKPSDTKQFYSLLRHAYIKGERSKIIWSDLPQAEHCLTPHLGKVQRREAETHLSSSCRQVYDYLSMKEKKIITDGLSLSVVDHTM